MLLYCEIPVEDIHKEVFIQVAWTLLYLLQYFETPIKEMSMFSFCATKR